MNDNVQNNNELDLLDLLKILFSKIKLIVCIALIAAILGGALSAAVTLFAKKNFGAQVEFYITPSSDSQVLHLLASERFAEKLLLDENGLPEGASGEEYNKALEAKQDYYTALENLEVAKKASKEAPRELAIVQKTYEEKQKAYQDAYDLLSIYKGAQDEVAKQEGHKEKHDFYENQVKTTKDEKDTAENAYYVASQKALAANHNLEAAKEAVANAKKLADEISEGILDQWRSQGDNREKISEISKSITYSYLDVETASTNNSENKPTNQFLVAQISIAKDEELATTLLDRMREVLPTYVEENVVRTEETDQETECVLISTTAMIENLAKKNLIVNVIKFALIAMVASIAVTCISVMITGVKELDKRKKSVYAENGDINAPLV